MNTKIRFVRCPKCQLVLPELAEVPVYKCGGCSTVLQAKPKHGVDVDHPGESSGIGIGIGISIHEKQDDEKQSEQVDLDEETKEDEDKSCMQSEAFFSTELGSCDEIEKQFQTQDLGTRSVDSSIGGSHPPLNMKSYYGSASSSARSSCSRSTRIPSNKLELLRMVYELEDELRQTRRMANSRYRRIPFSAEVTHYRYQPDCSPQLRHFSAQLPPPVPYPYDYCNSGYSSSQYSLHDSRQKLDEEMKKLHLREKCARMRHLRPVAGGAPILNCHYCRELVQLPAHFLLFKRKVHHLRCNACRNILKFSLQNKINLIPLYTQALTPSPSEVCDPLSSSHDTGGESFNKSTKHRKMKSHNSTLHSAPSPLHRLMGYSSPSQLINW